MTLHVLYPRPFGFEGSLPIAGSFQELGHSRPTASSAAVLPPEVKMTTQDCSLISSS